MDDAAPHLAIAIGAPDSAKPKLVVPFSACVDRFLAEG
jgi:hypothetical protein